MKASGLKYYTCHYLRKSHIWRYLKIHCTPRPLYAVRVTVRYAFIATHSYLRLVLISTHLARTDQNSTLSSEMFPLRPASMRTSFCHALMYHSSTFPTHFTHTIFITHALLPIQHRSLPNSLFLFRLIFSTLCLY